MKVEYHTEEDSTWLELTPGSEKEAFNLGVIYGASTTGGYVVRTIEGSVLRLALVKCLTGAERKPRGIK